ncbi:hypothetical protein [Nocardioides sp. 1609]|uniref:hypothetical protein n=1 Tax=Nocardioides sp. 1609 TaxID=2508327 RepID=UPI00106F9A63|nr:hypothetical protein [Nocardioides sp. 1609]
MTVVELIEEAGGYLPRAALVAATSRAEVDAALAAGLVVASGRGRYTTAATGAAVRAAQRVGGVLCLTSAALHHGWEVKLVPERPHVAVPRGRKISRARRDGVDLHRYDLHPGDLVDGVATDVETTLRHCLTRLPWDEALAVADSALRHDADPAALRRAAACSGHGSRQARRVLAEVDADAANPFESVTRAIALDVPGLTVRPQRTVRTPWSTARPDLVDEELRIAIECDSFEWHGGRAALAKDARRYNLLVVDGWLVLRLAWEDAMFDPAYVRRVLVAAVALVQARTPRATCRCGAA